MPNPKNASIRGDGFRFYSWDPSPQEDPAVLAQYSATEKTDVLSVTSIRALNGLSHQLVSWQINNIINAAMGTTKRIVIGPRGGRNETYVQDGAFPGTFATMLAATNGKQAGLDKTREWLRNTAEKPRDVAAIRGSIVHEAIEIGATIDRIDEAYVDSAVLRLSTRDQAKIKKHGGVVEEDVTFVADCVKQYWNLRVNVPFVILAREPQVWNLTAGYGGSADVLAWFLPAGTSIATLAMWQKRANEGKVFQLDIEANGGHVTLGDWKTSTGVWTDNIVQVHAYLAATFIGTDGRIDRRLTDILTASNEAAVIHIRPEAWTVHFLEFRTDVLRAFLGSVAYARFVATYPEPEPLFTHDIKGAAK